MTTTVLSMGFVWFASALFLHWLVWRCHKVTREMLWLFLLFLTSPFFFFLVSIQFVFIRTLEWTAVALLYYALALAYVQTYPALKTLAPSLKILLLIDAHGGGLETEKIFEKMTQPEGFFADKVSELNNDFLIRENRGRLSLTPFGRILADVFIAYRKLLGLEQGVG